jgi:predicted SprT family Zn-dependent metalloprotease
MQDNDINKISIQSLFGTTAETNISMPLFPMSTPVDFNTKETFPAILRYEFEPIITYAPSALVSSIISDLPESPIKIVKGILTKKEIIDFTLRVARRLKVKALHSRKQIHFARKGSTASKAYSGWRNYIKYADSMLQDDNIHYHYHTIIHEVCHILCWYKYGNGCNHDYRFVAEEIKAHDKFGYRAYYPTREEGYICALKELSSNKYVYVKYNYEINKDTGFPALKKKERRTSEWRKVEEHIFIAHQIKELRKEHKGAKVHTIQIAKGNRGWKQIFIYYKDKDGIEKEEYNHIWAGEMKRIFKCNVDKDKQRVGLIYEWKRKWKGAK